jgi:hypothetical protein
VGVWRFDGGLNKLDCGRSGLPSGKPWARTSLSIGIGIPDSITTSAASDTNMNHGKLKTTRFPPVPMLKLLVASECAGRLFVRCNVSPFTGLQRFDAEMTIETAEATSGLP